jgi:hypothetical protein
MARPRDGRQRVEDTLALRIADVVPRRRPASGFSIQGTLTARAPASGVIVSTIAYSGEVRGAYGRISFAHTPAGQRWAEPSYQVSIIAVDHPFGPRFRFRCPDGHGLVSTLYLPAGAEQFSSRTAHNLAYESEGMTTRRRAEVRAGRIRLALGGAPDANAAFPARPRGMWSSTYCRLQAVALGAGV